MFKRSLLTLASLCLALLLATSAVASEKVYVFAAASTTNAVKELIDTYKQESASSAEFLTSFASSSTLARQIDAGADANIFISANVKWYKWLDEKGLVEAGSNALMASNALVIIAGPHSKDKMTDISQLPGLLGEGFLAMGDATHVPAGMYGKEALSHYGLWEGLNKQLAQYPDVRKALNAVDTEQADFGIVYKTDAIQSKESHIVYTFAAESHTPVEYPICAVKGKQTAETKAFLAFMKSAKAKTVLEKYGFVTQ